MLDWAGSIGKIGQRPNESTQEMGDSGVVFFILLFWDFFFCEHSCQTIHF